MSYGQTSISPTGQAAAFAGLEADSGQVKDAISAWSEEASASMRFGIAVGVGAAAQGALLPVGSGTHYKGIVAHSYAHSPGTFGDLDATGVVAGGKLRVLRKGRIWVVIDQSIVTIVPWVDRGYARYSANGSNTILGALSNVNDSGKTDDITAAVLFTSAVVTAADGTKIAQVDVDFGIAQAA